MDSKLQELVRRRARGSCEYCRILETEESAKFHIEHIIARQHGGSTSQENLALACHHCNLHKGPNLSGIDPETGNLERLFNPRQDLWEAHFELKEGVIVGLTSVGRTTVRVLYMNQHAQVQLRRLNSV